MPAKKLSHAETRKIVEDVARQVASEHGVKLSMPALNKLLEPSAAFFSEHGRVSISRAQLHRELTPLLGDAAKLAPKPRRRTLKKKGGGGGRRFLAAAPKTKSLRAGDVDKAMARATCHFLWFC